MTDRTLTITLEQDWRACPGWQLRGRGSELRDVGRVLPPTDLPALGTRPYAARRGHTAGARAGAAARRLGRDVKRVHDDVESLAALDLVCHTDTRRVRCPFSNIHVDVHLAAGHPLAA
jgi:hypothetical protein